MTRSLSFQSVCFVQHSPRGSSVCVPGSNSSRATVRQRTRTAPQQHHSYWSYVVACFDSPAVLDGKSGSSRRWRTHAIGTETQRWYHTQGQRSAHERRGHPHRIQLFGKVCVMRCTCSSLIALRSREFHNVVMRTVGGDAR